MRTIKFRGKRVNRREWVYSTESFVQTDEGICMGLYNEEKDVIPDTVGQFTGLYDKDGKEIYEGDILLFHGEVKRVVWYEDSHIACFSLLCPYDFSFMSTFGTGSFEPFYCEVIGNIHDNPELLKSLYYE
jgi:uncharacterized phage protein (TIGR01671 family)